MSAALDFVALDGLAFAAERNRLPAEGLDFRANDLGPIIEFAHLSAGGRLPNPEGVPWLRLDGLGILYKAISSGGPQWICPDGKTIGYLRTGSQLLADTTSWTAFCLAIQQAAAKSGFPSKIAAQLAGAIGEMYSNIYEHSGAPETGLVAFRVTPGRLEFVVTDRGLGVLESLRTCPDYANLDDHGEALRLTLSDGVSRYGMAAKRGTGFRSLFVGLANLNGMLRFRSGDHALTINGDHPTLVTAKAAQKPFLKGFLISIACKYSRSLSQ